MAAKKVVTLAIAVFAALAAPPSARGQVSQPCCGMPTYTLKGIKVGTASDGTQYKTALWIINGGAGDWSYSISATIDPVTGQAVMTTSVSAAGGSSSGAGWNGGPNQHGAHRFIVAGYPDNTIPVQTLNVQIWSAVGYAITALVGHLDASGNLLEAPVALTDPQLLIPSVSTQFTLGLDTSVATEVAVNNTTSVTANVTFAAYDAEASTTNRTPFATATVSVPAGTKFCHLVSEIFSSFADAQNQAAFAAELQQYLAAGFSGISQGVLTVSADQPISVNTVLLNTKSDGTLLSTVWHAFPSDPTTATVVSVYGFNPTGNAWTKGTAVAGTYLILFGTFAASGNAIAIDGTVLPQNAILYQAAPQINVSLASLSLGAANHSAIVTALGSATAPAWFTVTNQ